MGLFQKKKATAPTATHDQTDETSYYQTVSVTSQGPPTAPAPPAYEENTQSPDKETFSAPHTVSPIVSHPAPQPVAQPVAQPVPEPAITPVAHPPAELESGPEPIPYTQTYGGYQEDRSQQYSKEGQAPQHPQGYPEQYSKVGQTHPGPQGHPGQHQQMFFPAQQPMVNSYPIASLNSSPGPVRCPRCGQHTMTRISHISGNFTHAIAFVLCITVLLCCIPYCVDGAKDVEHYCGNCNLRLATWHRSGRLEQHAYG